MLHLLAAAALPFTLFFAADLSADVDPDMPIHGEEIFVVGNEPFIAPVAQGQPVRVFFGVGELDVRAEPISEVRAEIRVTCPPRREKRCGTVRKKLRVEPKETPEGLEVHISGVRRSILKRLDIEGRVTVPEDSPLFVKAGIGDVDVHAGHRGVEVRMSIGDLNVRAPKESVKSVQVKTRIGDAGLRVGGRHKAGGRRALIGAGLAWKGGEGTEPVRARLRIGDAQVVLVD